MFCISRLRSCGIAVFLTFLWAASAYAHVDWTRVNAADPQLLGLYHFNSNSQNPGEIFESDTCVPIGRGLYIGTPSGANLTTSIDLVEPIFGPRSIRYASAQNAETTETLLNLAGDLTIEFWFKWENSMTSSSIEIGLRSGARIALTRDITNASKDRFGIAGTHGDYRDAPGFIDWPTAGVSEAPFDEWLHVGLTIHSTGQHFDTVAAHDVYSTGSLARFFLNGHPTGSFPFTLDLTGLKVHDASKLRVNNIAGGNILIDEVAIWSRDWSDNGANLDPFDDGRGVGNCRMPWTRVNDSDPFALGVYHFEPPFHDPGQIIPTVQCLPVGRGLLIGSPAGTDMVTSVDVPSGIFASHSMYFQSAQSSASVDTLSGLAGDLSIEAWFKWDNSLTSASVEFGLQSGAKIALRRDTLNPVNDRFGVAGTHGDYRPAPGFTNWGAVSPSMAPLGQWLHVGLAIHSVGQHYEPLPIDHDVYSTGTLARLYLNGEPVGVTTTNLDLTALKVHDASKLRINNLIGKTYLDEVTMWNKDWSQNGAVAGPFDNGRGTGLCNSAGPEWIKYD